MKLGITGLPASGKATVFAALTQIAADLSHKGEDHIGTIKVPDSRIEVLTELYKPKKTVYAQVEYFLPGVGGRSKEKKDQTVWIAVRDCDALIHVVRNFKGYGVEPPDPVRDFHTLDQEFIFSDLVVVEKRLERLAHEQQRGRKVNPEEVALLKNCHKNLENETPLRRYPELASAQLLKGFAFLSAKPVLILFNNEDEQDHLPETGVLESNENCLVIRGKLELELSQMSDEEAGEFLAEFNITASATDRVITKSYELQNLISFFTVGEDEVRAWTTKAGTPADDAAGVVHSDMKKGFIRAEVVSFSDLMDAGTYPEARKLGTVRLEGRTYIVQDGDIVTIRFNV